jgi:segregation and condensation protein A
MTDEDDPYFAEAPPAPKSEGEPMAPATEGGEPLTAPPAPAEPAAPVRVEAPAGVESMLPEDAPRILLPQFEGPIDLLLYLIRRDKIDINDIPIAPITRQYMEYLDVMQQLNLELAGEFLVMAATLIHIKSKLLVPADPAESKGEDDQLIDPRAELVQRLLEFERYKQAAMELHQREQVRAATFTRPETALPKFDETGEEMLEAGLFDLIAAFKEMLDRRKLQVAHEVDDSGEPLEHRMDTLLAEIPLGGSLEFLDLFRDLPSRSSMIVTFLALLELIRMKRVKVYQRAIFGPIRVFRPVGPDDAAPQQV